MRWPGTIQPSRFLSHTGIVLPGVRRVFTIPEPAAGAGFSFTVPGGVQWWVSGAYFTLTADATVDARFVTAIVMVDGLAIWNTWPGYTQSASTIQSYGFASAYGFVGPATGGARVVIPLPNEYLPEGAVVSVAINNGDAGDQLSACNLWIEEVYVTDPQLSEIARTEAELNREIAQYEYEQAEQAAGGA